MTQSYHQFSTRWNVIATHKNVATFGGNLVLGGGGFLSIGLGLGAEVGRWGMGIMGWLGFLGLWMDVQ
jgi:hypothetical protein